MHQYRLVYLIADADVRRSPAFERARAFAHKTGAALHISLPVYSRTIALSAVFAGKAAAAAKQALVAERAHALELEAGALRAEGLKVTTETFWTRSAIAELAERIERLRPELVLKDSDSARYDASAGHAADADLLRHCTAPVLLVHGETASVPLRVAAAVASEREGLADTAFNNLLSHTAAAMARAYDAELHLLHAEHDLAQPAVPMRHGHPIKGKSAPELPPGSFDAFAAMHHVAPGRRHRIKGTAVSAISDFVSRNRIDLLVLGMQPRPLWLRMLRGNKVARINFSASCDVLVMKPPHLWKRRAEPGAAVGVTPAAAR
jgi:universal stress protein E